MLASTNDPIAAMRRVQEAAARQAREGTRVGGTEPYQAKRKIQQQIDELRELVLRIPDNVGRQEDADGFTIVDYGSWKTLASVSIPRPSGKTRAVVSVTSMVTALTMASEVGRTAFDTRIVVNGTGSAVQPGQMEPQGAQYQRCTGYPSFVREIPGLTSSVTVQLQARGLLYDALPEQNAASLSVTAGFSTI